MAVSVSQINDAVNSQRESLLSALSRAPEGLGLQSIFWVIAALMAVVVFVNIRKGPEERKNIYGPIAIIIFCLSVNLGFNIMLIAWIVFFCLALALLAKLKQGEWKGVLMILVPMYLMGYIVSVQPVMMLVIAGLVTAVGWGAKKANHARTYGRSDAKKSLERRGFPVTKEKRVLKALGRIARKGFKWSKDPIVRTAGKLKQRFAERALRNEAEQMREAEIVAVSEDVAETLYQQQDQLSKMELQDTDHVHKILMFADQLNSIVRSMPEGAVEPKKADYIRRSTYLILKQLHLLVGHKLKEETLIEKANKILEKSTDIIHHSAHEATQLEEHKAVFKEIKKAGKTNIDAMRHQIKQERRDILKAIAQTRKSHSEGAGDRIKLLNQRRGQLEDVESKLGSVEQYLMRIDRMLMQINAREDSRINKVKSMSEKAKHTSKHLHKYERDFDNEAKVLQKEFKEFKHLFKEDVGMIADVQIVNVTNHTINMTKDLKTLTDITKKYHEKVLLPLVQEMAQVAKDISHLSQTSQGLTKLYFRLSQANEQLTKMAAEVDQHPEARAKLETIWKAEQFEEKLTRKAYRRGRSVVGHIKSGYKYLQAAYGHMQKHMREIDGFDHLMTVCKERTETTLNHAFKRLLGQELKQGARLKKEAAEALRREKQGMRAEKQARAA